MPIHTPAPVHSEHRRPTDGDDRWPIGIIVAAHWIAHGIGPQPMARDLIAAAHHGLIALGDPWTVTDRGQAALAEHGWL
ncbi:MAG TPA: hypothetical protein VK272_12075 [Solirubrobacteraceae bacterium]|nr:hypothetical protein [Solirubrobacteraceae bacterium]